MNGKTTHGGGLIWSSFFAWVILVGVHMPAWSQRLNPFEVEIVEFEKEDSVHGYRSDFILFTGSSSIRLWKDLEEDMTGLAVLNRGFGGSKLSDLNLYWDRILAQHKPKMVVLYCGENDISGGVSVQETFKQFKFFQKKYRKDLKRVPLIYVAMKPSPSRWDDWSDFQKTDRKIKRAVSLKKRMSFVDLSSTMLLPDGSPRPEIFLSDDLHMNEIGYAGWVKELRPIIEKMLEK